MRHSPLVSVVLPVRNGLPWLPAAVESITGQTLTDLELIVVDDGSTDGTAQVLDQLDDPRVRVIPTSGIGLARALNAGLAAARGRYIARQDADDESLPERLTRQVAALEQHPEIDVLATVASYIDADGRPVENAWVQTVRSQQDVALDPQSIGELMPLTCCITHGSIMARAEVLKNAGGYRPVMVPAEDYDLWLRLLPSHRFAKLAELLYRHRLHATQSGAMRRDDQIRRTILAKLLYLRRVSAGLPARAKLAIAGESRGDTYYMGVASRIGFELVPASAHWDVLAVTDFSRLADFESALGISARRIGNLFVRHEVDRPATQVRESEFTERRRVFTSAAR